MRFDLLSIFPDSLDSYLNSSIIKRAREEKKIKVYTHDIRESALDKHKTVDDTPYGGGPGMVMKIDVVYRALKKIYPRKSKSTRVILLSPRGETYDQKKVKELSKYKRIILIAGHYEAIDVRIDNYIDEKISLGNFILTGGELPAACIIDSVSRLVPGVLGKQESLEEESFSQFDNEKVNIEYPQYTRPEVFKKLKVPKILLSGHHKEIKKWRVKNTNWKKY